jgi:hypothetical protein
MQELLTAILELSKNYSQQELLSNSFSGGMQDLILPTDKQELPLPVLERCKNCILLSCRDARVTHSCPVKMQELRPPVLKV